MVPASSQIGSTMVPTLHRTCAAHINGSCDVEGLCRELPSRVRDLAGREGDRLAK